MNKFENINDILDFAINEEQKAVDLYTNLAYSAKLEEVKAVFLEFAKEEIEHKARLTTIKLNGLFTIKPEHVIDLKISDYSVSNELNEDSTYADALFFAMKKEKAAFKLYIKLAEKAPNNDLKNVFLALASEESKHKLRFELEYDEYVLREN